MFVVAVGGGDVGGLHVPAAGVDQDHVSFAVERHLENPLGENWRRGGVLHQTRRSVIKADDGYLGVDVHRCTGLGMIAPSG